MGVTLYILDELQIAFWQVGVSSNLANITRGIPRYNSAVQPVSLSGRDSRSNIRQHFINFANIDLPFVFLNFTYPLST